MGRDCWLAIPSNQWGKVATGVTGINITITSDRNTTAWIENGTTRDSIPVTAHGISSFKIPEAWEMESSGYVENKGIHVYSNDAELCVSFLSQQPNSGEGSYVIPTIGWGMDYVVAAYGSLFEGSGNSVYDYPSECTVVADEDSTEVTITPLCDCRQCISGNDTGNANSQIVFYPANWPIPFQLDRGQSVQLMPVKAQDPDNYDMTGTIIHANKPVGIIGASMLPNIPADRPYPNFVCEMVPPVRTWGETYYATNVSQPPGSFDDYARYLFISSKPGQTIYKYNCNQGASTECKIDAQYGIYSDELEAGEKFTSNAPFLCVWYINSSTYPDGADGNGDPAESVINPREQFSKNVLFQAPFNDNNTGTFMNYANVICKKSDASNVLFDGKSILNRIPQCLDDTFEIFTVIGIANGAHTVTSDSGVGVYNYAYGLNETYASSSPSGVATFQSKDSIPPFADTINACYQTLVHITDSGKLPTLLGLQSGLAAIWQDTLSNMTYQLDKNWVEGSGADTSGYTATVIDPSKPGFLRVNVYDLDGNTTTITTVYTVDYAEIKPVVNDLGVWHVGSTSPNIGYDTIFNIGNDTMDISELQLLKDTAGFSIFDSTGGPLDKSPLAPGTSRVIQIQFTALQYKTVFDSIIFGSGCERTAVELTGGGSADFSVSDQTWDGVQFPTPIGGFQRTVTIYNLSPNVITVDSAWWADSVHFKPVSTFPISIFPMPRTATFTIAYFPDSNSLLVHDRTQGVWFSPQVYESGAEVPRFDSLVGWAAAPSSVSDGNASKNATIIPTNEGHSLEIVLPPTIHSQVTFELVNVLGERVVDETIINNEHTVNASTLPRGMYFYKLTSGQWSQSGKVILGE